MKLRRTDDQQLVAETIRSFVRNEIRPAETELDPEAYTLPAAEHERLTRLVQEMGFYQLDVSSDLGGAGLDFLTREMVGEELSQHRAGLSAPGYGVFGTPPPGELCYANKDQRERYLDPALDGSRRALVALTEESGGADFASAIQTRAERDGEHWVLNGRKAWIAGAEVADFALVYARTGSAGDPDSISVFIVDAATPGFVVDDFVQMIWSQNTARLTLRDVRIPAENLLGAEGEGLRIARVVRDRRLVPAAAECIGVATYATELAADWAQQRITFGEPLANRQAIQWMLVDNEIDIEAARWLALAAAERMQAEQPFEYEASKAKLAATEGATRVVDRSMQIFGGLGMAKDMPFERWYRELRVRRITDGPTELHRMRVANRLLRRESDF